MVSGCGLLATLCSAPDAPAILGWPDRARLSRLGPAPVQDAWTQCGSRTRDRCVDQGGRMQCLNPTPAQPTELPAPRNASAIQKSALQRTRGLKDSLTLRRLHTRCSHHEQKWTVTGGVEHAILPSAAGSSTVELSAETRGVSPSWKTPLKRSPGLLEAGQSRSLFPCRQSAGCLPGPLQGHRHQSFFTASSFCCLQDVHGVFDPWLTPHTRGSSPRRSRTFMGARPVASRVRSPLRWAFVSRDKSRRGA